MANSNNEFYQNSMINARKDNDEWKNAAETCSATKTENTVPNQYAIMTGTRSNYGGAVDIEYVYSHNNSDVHTLTDTLNPHWSSSNKTYVLINPVKKLIYASSAGSTPYVYFTPTEDYVGIFKSDGTTEFTTTGTVTPGDGKLYKAVINTPNQSVTITAINANYVPVLSSEN